MKVKYYSLAIRKRINNDRFFDNTDYTFHELLLKINRRFWVADPFIFEKDGNTYVFYELFDLIKRKGCIAFSKLVEESQLTEPKIIICGNHKSFPFIFEYENEIFIIPESCEDNSVCIYQAKSFPDEWVKTKDLLTDVFATDSISFCYDNKRYLLTSEQYIMPPFNKLVSCWVKNRLYEISEKSREFYSLNKGIVVAEGDEGIRNAGAIFKDKNKLIRPGQNSPNNVYGKGLAFFVIKSICPYNEELLLKINGEEMSKHIIYACNSKELIGTHTYNSSQNYEIIDFSYYGSIDLRVYLNKFFRDSFMLGIRAIKKSIRIACKLRKKYFYLIRCKKEIEYKAIIDENAPWIFVSYIADPFYHMGDQDYLNIHQNKREALIMGRVFNRLGYNAYFMLYNSEYELPDYDFKYLFGHEPNIMRAKKKYPNAELIYYGVSTYYDYRNNTIKKMTKEFNDKYNSCIPERRLVQPHQSIENSKSILLIGSEYTKKTYPIEYQDKICKIHQSTQNCNYIKNLHANHRNEFLYIASNGNILKGVQAIIDFFSQHSEYELHWIGPIESDVKKAIQKSLTGNIKLYGFQRMDSRIALGLFERCDFMIYPSGVEGIPGAVLNSMKNGLIPLVTQIASFDGMENLGYIMENPTLECVDEAIKWAMSLDEKSILEKKVECQKFILNNFNLERFEFEFENFMRENLDLSLKK